MHSARATVCASSRFVGHGGGVSADAPECIYRPVPGHGAVTKSSPELGWLLHFIVLPPSERHVISKSKNSPVPVKIK